MVTALLGRKLRMTQLWDQDGNVKPVTVIQAGPCRVVQVKGKDGRESYTAAQLGFEELPNKNGGKGDPRVNKPMLGHFKKHGTTPYRVIREVRTADAKSLPESGALLKVDQVFAGVKRVDVIGTSKGRGFAGCIKRHKFGGGRATHGSKNHREPGAIGQNQSGHSIIRGKRLPGHFGHAKRTVRNLEVVKVEGEHDLLYVQGAIPGPPGGLVYVRKSIRS